MNILLVDDHAILRSGVRSQVERHLPGTRIHEAETLGEALAVIDGGADIDVVVLDLGLPDSQGHEGLMRLRRHAPATPVIVLSGSVDESPRREAMARGAAAFVGKDGDVMAILCAIEAVAEGETYSPTARDGANLTDGPGLPGLSERQREILDLCRARLSNKEIGRRLGISDNTVRSHLAMLFRRFGVSNRAALAALANARLRSGATLSQDPATVR